MKKRIVIILGSLGRGGAERVVSLIANDFYKRGWDVWIGLLLFNEVEYALNDNIHIVDLTGGKGSRIKKVPSWIFGIRKLIKAVKPDEVLSFAARMNVLTQFACSGLHASITVSERNDPFMDGRSKLVDAMTNLLYPKAKAVVFQTKRAASYFHKIKLKNSCIIANPISVAKYAANMKAGKVVTAGRLEPQKNQSMLIRAFAKIANEFPHATLTIYGRGNLDTELRELSQELYIEDRVFFPGNIDDIHEKISDANVFVLSSDYEGLSNALLEAMMMGLPCISTNCAGSDEYIENGVNGVLINTGDEEGLTNALIRLLSNPDDALKMGSLARLSSHSFESNVVLDEWFNVISGK